MKVVFSQRFVPTELSFNKKQFIGISSEVPFFLSLPAFPLPEIPPTQHAKEQNRQYFSNDMFSVVTFYRPWSIVDCNNPDKRKDHSPQK